MAELFDTATLAALMKVASLDEDQAAAARLVATALVRSKIGADPRSFEGERTVYLPVDPEGVVRLPALLDSIVEVTTVDDSVLNYTYREGSRLVRLSPGFPYIAEVKVTYTYENIPEDIVAAALLVAKALYGTTTASGASAAGIKSETVGPFSITYADSDNSSTENTAVDALLRNYRSTLGSVRLTSHVW